LDRPDPRGVADGVSDWAHRLGATGNAVVPQIPELIGRAILSATDSELAPTIPRRRSCKGGAMPADVPCVQCDCVHQTPRRRATSSPGAGVFS
jgi:hypothetical protein